MSTSLLGQVQQLLHSSDADQAMEVFLSRSDDPFTLYNAWKRLRTKLVRDPAMQRQDYEDHLEQCMRVAYANNPDGNDYHTLKSLLEAGSFPIYHNTYESIVTRLKSTFDDSDVIEMYTSKPPMVDAFYEFDIPQEIRASATKTHKERMANKMIEKEETTMSNEELEQIKNEAILFLQHGYTYKRNIGARFIEALLIVSGRRLCEILYTLELHGEGPTPYSAMVTGMSKQRASIECPDNLSTEPYLIPLLVPYDLFQASLEDMRRHEGQRHEDEVKHKSKMASLMRRLSRVVWGQNRKLKHADKRCLYCELTYKYRLDQNRCYPSLNKRMFTAKVLYHPISPTVTDVYSHYTFTN